MTAVVAAAWLGGPAGRGFLSIRKRYESEGVRLVQVHNSRHIPRDVDALLMCVDFTDKATRDEARLLAERHGIHVVMVTPHWSTSVEALRRAGVLDLVAVRRRKSTDDVVAVAQPQAEAIIMSEKKPPPPQSEEALRALLANLPAALLDVVLAEAPRLERRREAARVAALVDALDDDGALDLVVALPTTARLRLQRALQAAA
jgi:hypothetical protein